MPGKQLPLPITLVTLATHLHSLHSASRASATQSAGPLFELGREIDALAVAHGETPAAELKPMQESTHRFDRLKRKLGVNREASVKGGNMLPEEARFIVSLQLYPASLQLNLLQTPFSLKDYA